MKTLLEGKLLLVMAILFIWSGDCLKCFICKSDEDKGCHGVMNKSLSVECPTKPGYSEVYCRKIHQKLKFKGDKDYTFIRECAYEKSKLSCYVFQWFDIADQETCECDSESCNRGGNRKANTLSMAVSVFMWIFNRFAVER